MTKNDVNRALLIVLDGVGIGPKGDNNGWSLADTPNIDLLLKDYPSTAIQASGQSVGLPDGQMGNSEVGHMIIGSGKIFKQDLVVQALFYTIEGFWVSLSSLLTNIYDI